MLYYSTPTETVNKIFFLYKATVEKILDLKNDFQLLQNNLEKELKAKELVIPEKEKKELDYYNSIRNSFFGKIYFFFKKKTLEDAIKKTEQINLLQKFGKDIGTILNSLEKDKEFHLKNNDKVDDFFVNFDRLYPTALKNIEYVNTLTLLSKNKTGIEILVKNNYRNYAEDFLQSKELQIGLKNTKSMTLINSINKTLSESEKFPQKISQLVLKTRNFSQELETDLLDIKKDIKTHIDDRCREMAIKLSPNAKNKKLSINFEAKEKPHKVQTIGLSYGG